ncbi:MAG: AAA family ATPase [Candidatus Micrarchaeia archaeon]
MTHAKVPGYDRRPSGVYVPNAELMKAALEKAKIPADKKIRYLPQDNEIGSLDIARKTGHAALLVGPTGVGKSMLTRFMAQRLGLPYLYITCDPDATRSNMTGHENVIFTQTDGGAEMRVQQFMQSNVSIAAMCGQPVVLLIDEFHKLRPGLDAIFYPIAHERELNLSGILGPGEIYQFHPESLIVFALNPYYQNGGIEKVDQAMRQRLQTIHLGMISNETKLLDIVMANVPGADLHRGILEEICKLCAGLCRVFEAYRNKTAAEKRDADLIMRIEQHLTAINEAPSPRLLVRTAECIVAGQDPQHAMKQNIFSAITDDLGPTVTALASIATARLNPGSP